MTAAPRGWSYAKGLCRRLRVGDTVRLTHYAKRMGLQGRARSDLGRVYAIELPVGIVVVRDGLSTPTGYFAGLWRKP